MNSILSLDKGDGWSPARSLICTKGREIIFWMHSIKSLLCSLLSCRYGTRCIITQAALAWRSSSLTHSGINCPDLSSTSSPTFAQCCPTERSALARKVSEAVRDLRCGSTKTSAPTGRSAALTHVHPAFIYPGACFNLPSSAFESSFYCLLYTSDAADEV